MSSRYGHFDDEAREYVVTRPDTPLPWINYLGAEAFFSIVSNTGGGYSFFRDARHRRLTRYRYHAVPADVGARFLYVRDDATGGFWSPWWRPTRTDLEDYRCRHGLGVTAIASRHAGIEVESTLFVPPGENLEVWWCRVTNRRARPADLSLFGAVEFCLWDAWDDVTNFQRNLSTGEVRVLDDVIYHVTEYRERRNHFAYFACSGRVEGFDTQRERFVGAHGAWDAPRVVVEGLAGGSVAHGWWPIGALHTAMTLEPGAGGDVVFLLGYAENPAGAKFEPDGTTPVTTRARAVIDRYRRHDEVDAALDALRTSWGELLDRFVVRTPNEHVDRTANVWNPYQSMVTLNLSRSASLFESGIGRGIGFRDSNQDLLGSVHLVPGRARERILDLASTQLPSGGAFHQYQPLTKRGNDDIGSGFNDDPLWLVLSTAAYAKESGDLAILDAAVPYESQVGTESPLCEHLTRCIRYTLERLGPHGLPLIGRADWNDCLNLNAFSETPGESFQTVPNREGGVAESVFIAGLFVLAAREYATLAERRGRVDDAAWARAAADAMGSAIAEHGWDGRWFLRAYDLVGEPVGSHRNDEGQIYIEPQGMCVMAGVGLDDGRARTALRSVMDRLATEHGLVLLRPAYSRYRLELGEISSYPPGYKENGGVFCHTNPWVVIAAAMLGDGDLALDLYLRTNPSAREHLADLHRCEPYVFAQMIAGNEAATPGEAKNSWLTGAASWNLVALTQWILGIRPEHEGLRIDPCLPQAWAGFHARRRFRGAEYEVVVANPRRARGRVRTVAVDGRALDGNLVPPAAEGSSVRIVAEIEPA